MKVAFLIGALGISGGTYVILQHAQHLHREGHDVVIVPIWPLDPSQQPWHEGLLEIPIASLEDVADVRFDVAIVTWWRTMYDLLPHVRAERVWYLVQSIESRFYPASDEPLQRFVDATYDVPVPMVTQAQWIRAHLGPERDVALVPNGCRKDYYRPDGPRVSERLDRGLRVLVEGPIDVSFKHVPRTLALVRRTRARERWLLTSSPSRWYPGVHRVHSIVPAARCGEIYRSCDVLVKLSTVEGMFGPPLEMFHCGGTAVVFDVIGHDEYIRDGENGIVLPVGDEQGVIDAVNRLVDDPELLASLSAGALWTAQEWPDWMTCSRRFAAELERVRELPMDRDVIDDIVREAHDRYLAEAAPTSPPPRHLSIRGVRRLLDMATSRVVSARTPIGAHDG